MSDPTPVSPPPPGPGADSPPPRRRGVLGFLFRTPLGLLLVVLVLLGTLGIFAPAIAEGFVPRLASNWFSERYHGRLSIAEVDLGWRGPQTLEGIEIQDPSGSRVALAGVRLPGMWTLLSSRGKRLGKIEVVGEATLYADAAGRTNLESALEPRNPPAEEDESEAEKGSSSQLSELDLELDLRITRVYWADERTRQLGAPFVLENVTLAAVLRPGEPLTARLRGTLTGSAHGELSLDAKVENAFEPPSSATPPKAEIQASVQSLPTALVDAVTRQGGRLQALLGEDLSLQLDARGTVEQGTFELRLSAPRGEVRGSARVADGVLRSEGEGFAASFDFQREFVDSVAMPLVENGAHLERVLPAAAGAPDNGQRVRFALSSFEAPIGAYLEASAKGAPEQALADLLAGLRARWSAELGDWYFDGTSALADRGPLLVRQLALRGELNAPAETSKLELSFSAWNSATNPAFGVTQAASVPDAEFGKARFEFTFTGGAALALHSPAEALAPVRALARLENVPTSLFDSIAGLGGDLARAFGPLLVGEADVTAEIAAADPAAANLTWSDMDTRWRELARRASANLSGFVRGQPTGEGLPSLGGEPLSVTAVELTAKLVPGSSVDARILSSFHSRAQGDLDLQIGLANLFDDPASTTPVRFAVTAKASGLPTRVADVLSGGERRLEQLLGGLLALEATAQGTLDEGVVRVNLSSESAQVLLAGRLQNGMFVNVDEPALRVLLQPDAGLLADWSAGALPAGSSLSFAESRGTIGFDVNLLALPVRELVEASKQQKPTDELIAMALAKTRCDATWIVRELVYADEALRAAGQKIDQLVVQGSLELRPDDQSTQLTIDASASSPSLGAKPVDLHAEIPNAPELLAITTLETFGPITLRVHATQVPTAVLDAHAGGMLREALGANLDLSLDAQVAQRKDFAFTANTTLELASAGGKSKLVFQVEAKDPFNVIALRADPADERAPQGRASGVLPELDAQLDVDGAGALLAFAPAGLREPLRELCGEKIAARVELDEGQASSNKASLTLDAGGLQASGKLDYTDGILTTVAATPLVVRVTPTQAMIDRWIAGQLPAGASLKLVQPGSTLVAQISELAAPLERYLAADGSLAKAYLVENLAARLDVTLPPFAYGHPPAAAGVAGTSVELRDVQLQARMKPASPATVDLTGKVGAQPPGVLEVHATIEKPGGFVVEPPASFPAPGSRATFTAKLQRFPSGLLDALARQDGLIVDVLGPELEASVRGAYPDSGAETFQADLKSNLGELKLESRLDDGVIVAKGDQGLDARVGLTPLFSERIVGSLVPLLLDVRQSDPTERTVLTGRNLALPIDGDLAKLSGDFVLDLGKVDYQLLPGLGEALELGGLKVPTPKNTVIAPIQVKIQNGIARYDGLRIPIGGQPIDFRGNANLALKTFELDFAVPLELLGSKVESQLEQVRKYLDPKLAVPLQLSGSWKSPKLRLGKGFLEKVLKDAAEGALRGELEKGLGDLLGGGKKKKKDG